MMVAMEMTQTAGCPSSSDWRTRCLTCLLPEKPTGFDGDVSDDFELLRQFVPDYVRSRAAFFRGAVRGTSRHLIYLYYNYDYLVCYKFKTALLLSN
jgi:hypothetical protein